MQKVEMYLEELKRKKNLMEVTVQVKSYFYFVLF